MRILESYVVFLIFMMGMILADNDNEYKQFYKDMLNLHNEYRKNHGAKPLLLKPELSETALKIAMNFGARVDSNLNIGTNVYFEHDVSNLNAKNVFLSWYNEFNDYTSDDNPEMRSKTSCFTQIVWKSTTEIGMAVYPLENTLAIVVVYSPGGNVKDAYKDNVVIKNDGASSSSKRKKPRN